MEFCFVSSIKAKETVITGCTGLQHSSEEAQETIRRLDLTKHGTKVPAVCQLSCANAVSPHRLL